MMPVWISKKELADHLSIKPRGVNYLVKTGWLPDGVYLSPRIALWDLTEIESQLAKIKARPKKDLKDDKEEVPELSDVEKDAGF